jgi:hypothetical protein
VTVFAHLKASRTRTSSRTIKKESILANKGVVGIEAIHQSGRHHYEQAVEHNPLPFSSDVERRDTAEHADFPARGRIDNKHAVVRNELPVPAVKQQQEFYFCGRSIGKILDIPCTLSAI